MRLARDCYARMYDFGLCPVLELARGLNSRGYRILVSRIDDDIINRSAPATPLTNFMGMDQTVAWQVALCVAGRNDEITPIDRFKGGR